MSQLLKRYLERRYIDKNDKTISTLFPALGNYLRNRKVWKRLTSKAHHKHHEGPVKDITVSVYDGNNATALRIRKFLEEFRHPAIKAAIVQGSIATGEETAFSDFDGILIIDKDAIQNKRQLSDLHKIVHESAHLMKKQDVLQHHGWSILLKQEFKRYPDAELPSVLLEKGKMLFPAESYKISIVIDPEFQDYLILYENLCNGIYRRLDHSNTFQSNYHTKLLVSECLLLPAAFLQAIEKKSIWKGDSFERIVNYLPAEQMRTINTISDIRSNWGNYFTGKKKKTPVNSELAAILQKKLNADIRDLIEVMDNRLANQEKRIV